MAEKPHAPKAAKKRKTGIAPPPKKGPTIDPQEVIMSLKLELRVAKASVVRFEKDALLLNKEIERLNKRIQHQSRELEKLRPLRTQIKELKDSHSVTKNELKQEIGNLKAARSAEKKALRQEIRDLKAEHAAEKKALRQETRDLKAEHAAEKKALMQGNMGVKSS